VRWDLYSSSSVIGVREFSGMRRAGQVSRINVINAYIILVGNPERKGLNKRPTRRYI
jgi:hypothetical protein